jgi:radical SAM superfamily enzyme with C-terminal helix-hairpin-helix motif
MLERLVPYGTVIKRVFTEKYVGKTTFGRQVGTYPLLIGIPYKIPMNEFTNIFITSHGFRSITGINVPFRINKASLHALEAIPGIGKKRAMSIARARPLKTYLELTRILDEPVILEDLKEHLEF